MKEIIIEISDEGEVSVETRGFKGKTCIAEAQFLKDVLGTELSRKLTPAYYEQEHNVKKYLQLCG
jgi:hypothetical protein